MIVERMAEGVGIPPRFILSLARTASHEYKEYRITKRTGGTRVIHHPSRRLKALQRWLLINIIVRLPVHPSAMAYQKTCSIYKNAMPHANSRYLLRMDFKDFFSSITAVDIGNYIAAHTSLFSEWTSTDIKAFCGLVCRNSVLTIGAPTSPLISNALCYDLDVDINAACEKQNVTYTRYADDLFLSAMRQDVLSEMERQVVQIVTDLKIPSGLHINAAKTKYSSKRGARRVTGIVLGSDGQLHVGRRLKRKIRALIHRFDTLDSGGRASLAGSISYVVGFDPDFVNHLIDKYGLSAVRRAMGARIPTT